MKTRILPHPLHADQDEQQYLMNLDRDRHSFECTFDRLYEDFNDRQWLKGRLEEMLEVCK
jgi:hypothetical protein